MRAWIYLDEHVHDCVLREVLVGSMVLPNPPEQITFLAEAGDNAQRLVPVEEALFVTNHIDMIQAAQQLSLSQRSFKVVLHPMITQGVSL
jgi:hypothetical protein